MALIRLYVKVTSAAKEEESRMTIPVMDMVEVATSATVARMSDAENAKIPLNGTVMDVPDSLP